MRTLVFISVLFCCGFSFAQSEKTNEEKVLEILGKHDPELKERAKELENIRMSQSEDKTRPSSTPALDKFLNSKAGEMEWAKDRIDNVSFDYSTPPVYVEKGFSINEVILIVLSTLALFSLLIIFFKKFKISKRKNN